MLFRFGLLLRSKIKIKKIIKIKIVGERRHNKNWVKERIFQTWNDFEIKLANENPGFIVVYEDRTKEVISLIPLKGDKNE